jgi:hypothetical protein
LLVGFAAAACGLAVAAWSLRAPIARVAVGESCHPVVAPELDMIELIALRRKTTSYLFNQDQPLSLSDREMSWVLTEQYRVPVEIAAEGAVVTARKPIPLDGGGCGDLEFVGGVSVAGGVMRVTPSRVRFGSWPIPVFPGATLQVDPLRLGPDGPAADRLIHAIDSLEVRDGSFRLTLSDTKIIP